MKPATEEFLYLLLSTMDAAQRPTWRELGDASEGWAYRHGLLRRVRQLEEQNIIEVRREGGASRAVRLTEAGVRLASGGLHPPSLWGREWDGRWRMVLFDFSEDRLRARVRRALKQLRFGCLQRSVWISPEPASTIRDALRSEQVDASRLVIFDGRPDAAAGEVVAAAWEFSKISGLYDAWREVAAVAGAPGAWDKMPSAARMAWLRQERACWIAIARADPFLPAPLLPAGYPGRDVWSERLRLLSRLPV